MSEGSNNSDRSLTTKALGIRRSSNNSNGSSNTSNQAPSNGNGDGDGAHTGDEAPQVFRHEYIAVISQDYSSASPFSAQTTSESGQGGILYAVISVILESGSAAEDSMRADEPIHLFDHVTCELERYPPRITITWGDEEPLPSDQ